MPSNPSTARGSATENNEETMLCETLKCSNGNVIRCFIGEQGKRARFYRNGDQFFKVIINFLRQF